jgi:hypothetical protein
MKEETAKRACGKLLEITLDLKKWSNGRVERADAGRTRRYAIQIHQKSDLSDEYRIPKQLIFWAVSSDRAC